MSGLEGSPLRSARPEAGVSSGALLFLTLGPGLLAIAAREALPALEAAAFAGRVVLVFVLAGAVTGAVRAPLARLVAERLAAGDLAALGPASATVGALLAGVGAAVGLALGGGGGLAGPAWAGLSALAFVTLAGTDALAAGRDRETTLLAAWAGLAISGGLLVAGGRAGGAETAAVGASAGLVFAAAAVWGRLLGASRHSVVALSLAPLRRLRREPFAAALGVLLSVAWTGPALVSLAGAVADGAPALEAIGGLRAASAAIVALPPLVVFFLADEGRIGREHRALLWTLGIGLPLATVEAVSERARAAVRVATARAAAGWLLVCAIAISLAPRLTSSADAQRELALLLGALAALGLALPATISLCLLDRAGRAAACYALPAIVGPLAEVWLPASVRGQAFAVAALLCLVAIGALWRSAAAEAPLLLIRSEVLTDEA